MRALLSAVLAVALLGGAHPAGALILVASSAASSQDLFDQAGVARDQQGGRVKISPGPGDFVRGLTKGGVWGKLVAYMTLRSARDFKGFFIELGSNRQAATPRAIAFSVDNGDPFFVTECEFSEVPEFNFEEHLCELGAERWDQILGATSSITVQVETTRGRLDSRTLSGKSLRRLQSLREI